MFAVRASRMVDEEVKSGLAQENSGAFASPTGIRPSFFHSHHHIERNQDEQSQGKGKNSHSSDAPGIDMLLQKRKTSSGRSLDGQLQGEDTSKPSAIFKPAQGRTHTVSIALPGSIIAK